MKTYFQKGGMQVQFNIMDYKMLINALENAGEFSDLIVRVSGYSAYFKDLSQSMKEEIIARTAYDIGTGSASNYPDDYRYLLPCNREVQR